MAIYTRRGDKGETSLYCAANKQIRVSKSSPRINAIGSVDELNSYIGVCLTFCEDKKFEKYLVDTQKDLLAIGSILAGSKLAFSKAKTKKLEKIIDEFEKTLPLLKNFILPGGTKFASHLQYARSLTRRAERNLVSMSKKEKVRPQILEFINRLSDFMFILSRAENYKNNVEEEVWVGNKHR